jgi:hypothetical protein
MASAPQEPTSFDKYLLILMAVIALGGVSGLALASSLWP